MIHELGSGKQKPNNTLVYFFTIYVCQICINLNLDVETIYMLLIKNLTCIMGRRGGGGVKTEIVLYMFTLKDHFHNNIPCFVIFPYMKEFKDKTTV